MSIAQPRILLADAVVPRSAATSAALIVAGAALTGLLAQVGVPLWPVPITGQTLGVLLVGSALGAGRGAASMLLYALLGLAGVPWFSDHTGGASILFGPTGGYILGFVLGAWVTGALAARRWDRSPLTGMVASLAGSAAVFAVGLPWLSVSLGLGPAATLQAGLWPFVLGGVVKAAIAAAVTPVAWRLVDAADRRR